MLFLCLKEVYMRKKYIRELKKSLKKSNLFWEDDIKDFIYIANITFKKCLKKLKEKKRKKYE